MVTAMSKEIDFHFKGSEADAHLLPVEYIINLLEGIRDLAYLTVAQQTGSVLNERFRPSGQIKNGVIVRCKPAVMGSYAQALVFDSSEDSLFPEFGPEGVCSQIKDFIAAVAMNDLEKIKRVFSNGRMRRRALQDIRKALPPSDSGIYVEVDNDPSLNSRLIHLHSSQILDAVQVEVEDFMTLVTGRLIGIQFEQRKLIIQHPVLRRSLDCYYNEEVEPMLLDHRRELIQVTGNVRLDANDMPAEITDVFLIQEVDLSPIELDRVVSDGLELRFRQPVSLRLELDESCQLFVLREPELGLDLFAYTRSEIVADLHSETAFLWKEFAHADDAELTEPALILKRSLLAKLEEVPHE